MRPSPHLSSLCRLVAVGAALILYGCQGPLAAGIQAFDEARYPDAAVELRGLERGRLSERESSQLALYRGLSELAMGNLDVALPQLQYVRCALERQPSLLSVQERGRLASAWRAVGRMPGESLTRVDTCREE
jgi:hypothetical protein